MAHNIVLTAAEEKLADIVWREAPIGSMELVGIAFRELEWKKSTTFTMLRKLAEKGVIKNENATVTAQLTKNELLTHAARGYVEEAFGGSLPMFVTSFFGGKKLAQEKIAELNRLIDEYEEGESNG